MQHIRGKRRVRQAIVGLCHVVICSGAASAQSVVPAGARQLVVPFDNASHDARLHWLSDASAIVLTEDLVALGATALSRDERLRAFEQLHVPSVSTLSEATIIRVGQLVGAAQVVVGAFEVKDEALTVRVRAIRLDAGRMFPEIVERGALSELFAVYARVARRILPGSAVSIAQMEQGHPPLAAFEQYVKGILSENPATQMSFLKEALRLAPQFQEVRVALWSAYTDQREYQQALDIVRQLPAGERPTRAAKFFAAISLIHLARNAEAVAVLTELNEEKSDAALLNDIGVALLRRSTRPADSRPADSYLKEAVTANPNDPDLTFNLGYAYWVSNDVANAVTWLRETVRRNPADDAAHWILGVALQMSGNAAEGQREKDLAKRLSSTYVDWAAKPANANTVPPALERIKMELGVANGPRLEDTINAAGQRDQREVAAFHLQAGRRLFQADRTAEAIAELRRSIYLAPYDHEAHLLLGRLYLREGRVQQAIDEFKISIWSDDQITGHVALAEAYLQANDSAAARSEVEGVLTRDPENAEAKRLLDRLR